MNEVPPWLGLLGVHQDLIWFWVLLGWCFSSALWWRVPAQRTVWAWVPWVSAAGILTALVQFFSFNPPFEIFHELLIPGAHEVYLPALIAPDLLADIVLASGTFIILALWWHRTSTAPPWVGNLMIGLCAVAVPVQINHSWMGALMLTALPWVAAVFLWRREPLRLLPGISLMLATLLPLISPVGPLALLVDKAQRDGATGWFGAVCALIHLLTVVVILTGLIRDKLLPMDQEERHALWEDFKPFWRGGILWLTLGVGVALLTGFDNTKEIKVNRMRLTAARAEDVPAKIVDRLAIPFTDDEAVRSSLEQLATSLPFLKGARFITRHDDDLVAIALREGKLQATNLGPIKSTEETAWAEAQPDIISMPVPEAWAPYYTRVPIADSQGRMAGWLEFKWVEFYMTLERKWRTSPLLVTALGAVLAAVFFVQRRSSREREEALRAVAISAETARLKTSFLAKVSHELRTPLQSILGYGELLQTALPPDGPAQKQLAALRQHGQLMTRLVNDLIDLSALESGAFRLIEKPVNPTELISQTIDSLRPTAEKKRLALRLNIDPELPLWISADGERLREILINLTANAIKFTPTGSVDVSVTRFRDQPNEWLEIKVVDTGPGIAPADQDNIFQPFSRLSLTADQEGSGLGLTLISGLCQSMMGTLTLESTLGRGSCFRVRLPLHSCPAPTAALPVSSPDLLLHGKRVLVADDNSLIRELFINYLGELGAECVIARDGEEALLLAQNGGCEAMILDLAMPKISGCEVARQLKRGGTRLRIIGVSAHTDAADREEALAAGMDEFLTKPVELAALGRAISGPPTTTGLDGMMQNLQQGLRAQFRRNAPEQINALTETFLRRDWEAMRPLIHHLRNSAIAINDETLEETCAQAESALIRRDLDKITATWTACTVALNVWLPPKPDATVQAG